MILIVGLGNPGHKYEKTRHNIGFRVIDSLDFGHSTELSRGPRDKGIILLKPRTYMNQSGKAVKKIIENCKLKIENLYVVHDDIDLPLGTIRISQNITSGGHKGVQSIINALGTKDFLRFRIGIGREQKKDAEKFVLEKFSKQEEKIVEKIIKKIIEIIKENLEKGIKKTTIKII